MIEGDFLVERNDFLQFQLHAPVSRFITAYEVRKKAKAAEPTKPIESLSISAFEARFAVLMADSAGASVRTASVSKTPLFRSELCRPANSPEQFDVEFPL